MQGGVELPCKYCGQEGAHYCFPSYCIEKLGRDCGTCTNVCMYMRDKIDPAEPVEPDEPRLEKGDIVVEEVED